MFRKAPGYEFHDSKDMVRPDSEVTSDLGSSASSIASMDINGEESEKESRLRNGSTGTATSSEDSGQDQVDIGFLSPYTRRKSRNEMLSNGKENVAKGSNGTLFESWSSGLEDNRESEAAFYVPAKRKYRMPDSVTELQKRVQCFVNAAVSPHWPTALRKMVEYYSPKEYAQFTQLLDFCCDMLEKMEDVVANHTQPGLEEYEIMKDEKKLPPRFPYDYWLQFFESVGCSVKGQKKSFGLRYCQVILSRKTSEECIVGALTLLQSLYELNYYTAFTILKFSNDDITHLQKAIYYTCSKDHQRHLTRHIKPMWKQHKKFLEHIGFKKTNINGHKHYVLDRQMVRQPLHCLYTVLYGLSSKPSVVFAKESSV